MPSSSATPEKLSEETSLRSVQRFARAWWWAAGVCCLVAIAAEVVRWSDPEQQYFALFGVLAGQNPDWFPYLPWGLALLLMWWLRPGLRMTGPGTGVARPARSSTAGMPRVSIVLSLLVTVVGFLVSGWVGAGFVGAAGEPFPPAYHDEYSYLFQAETFLAGRTSFASFEPQPALFDQMHVLNLGRFASRYFPGVGVWLAPFVAIGNPWLGYQIAQALCAGLMFWIGRELRDDLCGLVAGLLFAVSPGLSLFSTLLLAHHPTLLGLLVFLWAFLRWMRCPTKWLALLAGTGLAYAMLCRPMTAAGFGLPFGLWTVWSLVTGRAIIRREITGRAITRQAAHAGKTGQDGQRTQASPGLEGDVSAQENSFAVRFGQVLLLGLPLVAGIAVMLWYSASITGDPLVSPYQLYTDIYTPRHVYGFNNVVRGEQHLGPHVMQAYDEWAQNLTPALAVRNTGLRLLASWRMSLGIFPILFAVLFLVLSGGLRGRLLWVAMAIGTLFLVHVPYWFVGIMGWHYVLEATPLWLLLCGVATSDLWRWGRQVRWSLPTVWWGGVLLTAVWVNSVHIPIASGPDGTWWLWRGRLPQLMSEVRFARGRYDAVAHEIDRLRGGESAVILVMADPSDTSLDYVTNSPGLDGEVLRVRVPLNDRNPEGIRRLQTLFPGRKPILMDATTGQITPLSKE